MGLLRRLWFIHCRRLSPAPAPGTPLPVSLRLQKNPGLYYKFSRSSPRKLQHTPISHPDTAIPHLSTHINYERNPFMGCWCLLVKVFRGVFGVSKQPSLPSHIITMKKRLGHGLRSTPGTLTRAKSPTNFFTTQLVFQQNNQFLWIEKNSGHSQTGVIILPTQTRHHEGKILKITIESGQME